ncbi:MAG TPA: tetratricopeptide repeat protein [Gemmatimonadaceae bacterium]|nr:tetratricopeptide repeat protein [Gemmatimonadaceae bacterium]
MSNTAKLKKKAAEFEAKKQYEKALELYEQVLNGARASDEERDVPLYNRVGDIHYRIGNNDQAISYYEQAADLYAEGGFFNNAIALCNKILRYSPGRTIVYYKLGIISAKKGFNSDAKQNFLEYADRMQRIGKMDEAFRALKEFADLCPGQDDVRLMLAEQLSRADRKEEALEQLEILYDTLAAEGRTSEAAATVERMKTIDPAFKPRRSATPRVQKKEGLVFLDLDFEASAEATGPVAPSADDDEFSLVVKPRPSRLEIVQPDEPAEAAKSETAPQAVQPEPEAAQDAPEGLELTSFSDIHDPSMTFNTESIADPQPSDETGQSEQHEERLSGNELKFITPDEPQAENDLPDISPIDLAPLVEETGNEVEEEKPVDTPYVRDPQIIEFPVGRTPAGSSPGVRTPNGIAPLSGLPVIGEEGSESDYDDAHSQVPDDDFVDLGEWLERTRTPASTRMIAYDEEPENNEQKDFAEMLEKFKAGVSRNVDEEDFESHYDLGIAFAEMGLIDEAIGSFQKAQRGPDQRVRASEAIGQCFMDKGETAVAVAVLNKLLHEPGMSDSRLVGVLYLLGRAAELLGRSAEASGFYQRVLAVHIGFRDASERLTALTAAAR